MTQVCLSRCHDEKLILVFEKLCLRRDRVSVSADLSCVILPGQKRLGLDYDYDFRVRVPVPP